MSRVPPHTFHLIYHVAPFAYNRGWRVNVRRLLDYRRLFNGKRVIGVVTGPDLDPPEEVRDAFPPDWAEFVVLPNDPARWETDTMLEALRRVATDDTHHATFRAHAKGVASTRSWEASARWRDSMYRFCLSCPEVIRAALSRFGCVGSHRRWISPGQWHFAGSFYWFRNDEVFTRPDWERVYLEGSDTHTIERLPSLFFAYEDSLCLAMDGWSGDESRPGTFGPFWDPEYA